MSYVFSSHGRARQPHSDQTLVGGSGLTAGGEKKDQAAMESTHVCTPGPLPWTVPDDTKLSPLRLPILETSPAILLLLICSFSDSDEPMDAA